MLSRLTIRARLLVLGVGAVAMLGALGAVAIISMQGMSSQSSQSSHDQAAAQLLNHAYESWILDDDPVEHVRGRPCAERSVAAPARRARRGARRPPRMANLTKRLAALKPMLNTASEHARLGQDRRKSQELQRLLPQAPRFGKANKVHQAVHVMTVDNAHAVERAPGPSSSRSTPSSRRRPSQAQPR